MPRLGRQKLDPESLEDIHAQGCTCSEPYFEPFMNGTVLCFGLVHDNPNCYFNQVLKAWLN